MAMNIWVMEMASSFLVFWMGIAPVLIPNLVIFLVLYRWPIDVAYDFGGYFQMHLPIIPVHDWKYPIPIVLKRVSVFGIYLSACRNLMIYIDFAMKCEF